MRAAPWIGSAALVGAIAVTVIGARTQAADLVAGWQSEAEHAVRTLGAESVRVRASGRVVRVWGQVDDEAQRDGVLSALGTIDGVTVIDEGLAVLRSGTRSSAAFAPDSSEPRIAPEPERPAAIPQASDVEASPAATPEQAAASPCQEELDALFRGEIIRFAPYSAAVDPLSAPLLDDVAEIMAKCPGTVLEIAGHSDGSGIDELNESLSLARAESVRQRLVQRGIESSRLIAVGYGDRVPIADDSTEAGRMRNRRIELQLREAR